MSLSLVINQPFVSVGLPTWAYTVPTGGAGLYTVHVECSENPPSGISILVKKGGSTVYTAPTLAATQGGLNFSYTALYAAADAITVVMASSSDIDNQLNTVKTTCTIHQGD